MNQSPFHDLISNRGFDRYQRDLEPKFQALGFQLRLTYREPTDDPALRLELDSDTHLSDIILWESGLCDLEVLRIYDGKQIWMQHLEFKNEQEFQSTFPLLINRLIETVKS